MEFKEPKPEKIINPYLKKIKEFFGDDLEIIENPEPEELFDLVFSTIRNKEVDMSGEARMEETVYIVTDDEDISILEISKDCTTRESKSEGWEEPCGGELIIDGLSRIPIDKKIIYLIKQQEIISEMERPIPDSVPDEMKKELEQIKSKSRWLEGLKKISELKKQRDGLADSNKELNQQISELEQRIRGAGPLLEDKWVTVYRFDGEKVYNYLKEHENDENFHNYLFESENFGKCKYWLSEY